MSDPFRHDVKDEASRLVPPTLRYRPLREGDGDGPPAPWTEERFEYVEGCGVGEGPAFDALSELARGGGRWLAMVTPGGIWLSPWFGGVARLADQLTPRPESLAYLVRDGVAMLLPPPETLEGSRGIDIGAAISCRSVNAVEWWDEVGDARFMLLAKGLPLVTRVRATVAAVREARSVFSDTAWDRVREILDVCDRCSFDDDRIGVPPDLLSEPDPEGARFDRHKAAAEALLLLLDVAAIAATGGEDLVVTREGSEEPVPIDHGLAFACGEVASLLACVIENAPSARASGKPSPFDPDDIMPDRTPIDAWLAAAADAVRCTVGDAWFVARCEETP